MAHDRATRTRRGFVQGSLALVSFSVLTGCGRIPVFGQQPKPVSRIGYLGTDSPGSPNSEAFRTGLGELG